MPTSGPDDSYVPPVQYKVDEEDLVSFKADFLTCAKIFREVGRDFMAKACELNAEFIQGCYLDFEPDGTYRGGRGETNDAANQ